MIITSTGLILTILVFSLISLVLVDGKILRLLRNESPEIFEEVGSPSLWVTMSTKYSYWFNFLLLGKFQTYNLPKQTRKLCVINRVMILTIIALWVI